MDIDNELSNILIEERDKKDNDLILEIPHILQILDNMGSRIKIIEKDNRILTEAISSVQGYASEEGCRRLKREAYNYVMYNMRRHILNSMRHTLADSKDLLKVFTAKVLKKDEARGED